MKLSILSPAARAIFQNSGAPSRRVNDSRLRYCPAIVILFARVTELSKISAYLTRVRRR